MIEKTFKVKFILDRSNNNELLKELLEKILKERFLNYSFETVEVEEVSTQDEGREP